MKMTSVITFLSMSSMAFASSSDEVCRTLGNIENSSQIVVVKSLGDFKVEITPCELKDSVWRSAGFHTFPGVVGKNGVAPEGEKQEGDWKTPLGLFPIGPAFGSEPLALKMDYRYITSEDKFIDDSTSPQYNTWVTGETDAKSYENMLISVYKMGAVVQYNMHPTIPWKGSAIFLHLWRSHENPTGGCIAMDEHHLSALLKWFDKSKHPQIYITN